MNAIVAAGNVHRRLVGATFGLLGPARAYALMALLARRFYRLADDVRTAGETRVLAALTGTAGARNSQDIAERAFVHRMWNLVDLALAPRLLRPSAYRQYGGRIEEGYRAAILDARRRGQPVLLLTAYYGPYDLLPVFLGLNGIAATAVYRPHPNREFDRFRQSVRTRTGCRMMAQAGAAPKLADLLEAGETVALLADHVAGRVGVRVSFLGEAKTAPRTIGLLAERYGAAVSVTVIRRVRESFGFEIVVGDLFGPDSWRREAEPVEYITRRYHRALERLVLERPEQYLWLRGRWTQPPSAGPGPDSRSRAATGK